MKSHTHSEVIFHPYPSIAHTKKQHAFVSILDVGEQIHAAPLAFFHVSFMMQ